MAQRVLEVMERNPGAAATPVYRLEDKLEAKIQTVAQRIYGADRVHIGDKAQAKRKDFTDWGFGGLPICVAKTQHSLSDNPKVLGAPRDWEPYVTDATLCAGAGFVVLIAGNMMPMPALPKMPRALEIDVDEREKSLGCRRAIAGREKEFVVPLVSPEAV